MAQAILSNLSEDSERASAPPVRSISRTLGEQVMELIVRMIGDGRLAPGQRLVEATLARELGVGTVPVREALRTLAGDGVVELRPNRGAVLRHLSRKELIDTLKAVAGLLSVALDALTRDALEPIVPRLRAITVHIMEAAARGDKSGVFQGGAAYQREILIAADNHYILRTIDRVHFEFYSAELVKHVHAAAVEDLAKPYVDITNALIRNDIPLAQALYSANARHLGDWLD